MGMPDILSEHICLVCCKNAARIIATLIVSGSGILIRAFAQAYRQALVNASKNGVAEETLKNVARKGSKVMTAQEARQILGVSEHSTWEEIAQKYDKLFESNAKNGSFYLQSKVHRAKECLEDLHKVKNEGAPNQTGYVSLANWMSCFMLFAASLSVSRISGLPVIAQIFAQPVRERKSMLCAFNRRHNKAFIVFLFNSKVVASSNGVVSDVLKTHLLKYGKQWDLKTAYKIIGKTPLEAAAAVIEDYELPLSPDEFLSETNPIFSTQWCNIKPQPGANRLISHLRGHGVPMALASNSPRENVELKISYHPGWKEAFSVIVCGDEVKNGKPSPEIFLEAAKRLNIDPSSCLVIEDSIPGVTAGKAAGMEVVAVPSVPKQSDNFAMADEVINSLLDLQPEKWGLPPFQDWIEGTLPIEPWHIGGPVVKGFGRGSKVLGIPTANLSIEGYSDLLSEYPSGVYFGWAGLSGRGVFKMVMSIGWNPYFNNTEKTIEPWLLHEFKEDFYGEELHLVIVGYIRPETNFPSLESLIAKIYEDRGIAERALDLPQYSEYKSDPYLLGLNSQESKDSLKNRI
ncbi:OLC1v1021725C1 [Oldenlandia corymbosa var. corymbosa]|uniref:riboflavin kinase n=1 Tax=Oldenlandia corymbosa var. corymbosa TaxID=529605 RepID=A0AAV1BWB1_OLDCO|nr:OLC1v1021725C1 [Oldenlandia corymbosa var. corymbosa]